MSGAPAFNRGFRMRFDQVRDGWVMLAPERLFLLDEPAVAVLQLVDGFRSIDQIVDVLTTRYEAPRELIAADVVAMLQDLSDKGAIRL